MIREEQSEQRNMRTEQQARLVRDVGDSKFVPAMLVSDGDTGRRGSECSVAQEDVRIFLPEVAFSVMENNLDQYSRLLSAFRVRQQGHLDVLVTDRQQSRRPIARYPSKLHDKGQLHAVPFVRKRRLRRGV